MNNKQMAALAGVISDFSNGSFRLGKRDCLLFARSVTKAVHEVDFGEQWVGQYAGKSADALRTTFGYDTFRAAISDHYTEVPRSKCRRGMIVACDDVDGPFDIGLGVCVGQSAIFVGTKGLEARSMSEVVCGWEL